MSEPLILSPGLFRSIERLCRDTLTFGGNSTNSRSRVIEVMSSLRVLAQEEYGHDTPEVMALVSLLNRTDPRFDGRPEARPDPLRELEQKQLLSINQIGAAWWINEIWLAWSRHLVVRGQRYESDGGGGSRSSAASPVDTMSQRVWDMWLERYIPWCKVAKSKPVGGTNAADLVIRVVVESYHIDFLATNMGVSQERILKVLRRELDRFNDIK